MSAGSGGASPQRSGAGVTHVATVADLLCVDAEAVAVFCWADVRPLRGAAGLLDWRLCGMISGAMEADLFAGAAGETVLMPTRGRFGRRRLFLFGLGSSSEAQVATLQHRCADALAVLARAGAGRVAVVAAEAAQGDPATARFADALARVQPAEVGLQVVQSLSGCWPPG